MSALSSELSDANVSAADEGDGVERCTKKVKDKEEGLIDSMHQQ